MSTINILSATIAEIFGDFAFKDFARGGGLLDFGKGLAGRNRYVYNREILEPIARQLNQQANVANGHGNRRNRQSEEGAIRALYGMHIHGNRRRS